MSHRQIEAIQLSPATPLTMEAFERAAHMLKPAPTAAMVLVHAEADDATAVEICTKYHCSLCAVPDTILIGEDGRKSWSVTAYDKAVASVVSP